MLKLEQGLCSSVATTFNTPLLLGGPATVCAVILISNIARKNSYSLGRVVLDSRRFRLFHTRLKYSRDRERVPHLRRTVSTSPPPYLLRLYVVADPLS